MTFNPFHQHLIVKGKFKNPTKSVEVLDNWLTELVHKVDMEVLAGPNSVYCDHPGNEGITGTIVLSTSHASIHMWDSELPGLFQFDIYSCKPFEAKTVLDHLEHFEMSEYEFLNLDRNDKMFISESGSSRN